MHACLTATWLALGLASQEPKPVPPTTPPAATPTPAPAKSPATEPPTRIGTVQYDSGGWPIVPDDRSAVRPLAPPAAPAVEPARRPTGDVPAGVPLQAVAVPEATSSPPLVSGSQLGSPLLDVFQSTRAPAAFKALGGIVVWWRLSIYGAQGEVIGVREVTHTADCAFAERDRLEHADGRVYGRSGASVFAERQGMPWPLLTETAQHELALFGLQLRLPWCFGDGTTFAVIGRDTVTRSGELLTRIQLERRPPAGLAVIGPELDPAPRDRFELLHEPSNGALREFVHRFASSMQTRRVLLEDWRDVAGVRMPYRRVYTDDSLRQTTTFEVLRIEQSRVTERDFRLR